MILEFTVMGAPVAKGRGRGAVVAGHVRIYTPEKTREAEATFAARVVQHVPKSGALRGPLRLDLLFHLPIPSGWSKKRRGANLVTPENHFTRPDLDNLVKLVKDACTGLFWIDDKFVCEIHAKKVYGDVPRTEVAIQQLTEGE